MPGLVSDFLNMVSFRPRDMGQKFPFQLADMKMAKINGGVDQNYLLHPGMIVQGSFFFSSSKSDEGILFQGTIYIYIPSRKLTYPMDVWHI